MKKSYKTYLTLLAKLIVTTLAIYFVITKIDFKEAWSLVRRSNVAFLLLAWLTFLGSKLIAAFRLNDHLSAIDVNISHRMNVKLYLLGMYYNLFLPGGIGGDGYKAYWLNKRFEAKLKDIISILLLDRVNGLVALGVFALAFTQMIELPYEWLDVWIIIMGIIVAYVIHYVILQKIFKKLINIFITSHLLSLLVQSLQLMTIFCLLMAMGIGNNFWGYGFVFLISSIVSVLPLTIGGIGSREVVFLLGAEVLHLDQGVAITVSVLFYFLTAITSFSGIYFAWVPTKLLDPS